MSNKMRKRLAVAFRYSAIWWLEKVEGGEELTDEEDRNVNTFWVLAEAVADAPTALVQETAMLAAKHPRIFQRSLTASLSSVSDKYRPQTAAEFVEKLNERVRYAGGKRAGVAVS
jgi:hypothetical protein